MKTANSSDTQILNLLRAVEMYVDEPWKEKRFDNLKRAMRHAQKYMWQHMDEDYEPIVEVAPKNDHSRMG